MNETRRSPSIFFPARQARWLLAVGSGVMLCAQAFARSFDDLLASDDTAVMLEWGKRYFYGVMAPQNIDQAIEIYCAAARQGSGEAQYRLGEIYSRTLAGKRDDVLAAAWFLKAALSSYSAAKKPLARWDLSGVDIPAEPPCALSGDMVSRSLPAARKPSAEAPKAVAAAATPAMPRLSDVITRREVEMLVKGMAPEFELNPELVLAIIQVESNFNAKAQSPKRAQGLMQLIPATARRFGVTDPWDPRQNLRGGMSYLRWLLKHFNGDVRLALAGYNAGEGAVERHGGVPPYSETQGYLRRIAGVLGVAEDELSQYRGRPNAFVTQPREVDSESDWESRFFDVDLSG